MFKTLSVMAISMMLISCGSFGQIIEIAKQNANTQENNQQNQNQGQDQNQNQNQNVNKVKSISIVKFPAKTLYQLNEEFDSTGLVVEATFDNNETKQVTDYSISDVDTSTNGNKMVIIYYQDCSASFSITVGGEKQLNGIEITSLPTKIEYTINQAFDPTGLVVSATYNDASKEQVTNYTIGEVNTSNEGVAEVSVKYRGYVATFNIAVVIPEIDSIEVAQLPNKVEYLINEQFDSTGLTVNLVFVDNTKAQINDYVLGTVDTSTTGTKTVTVSYKTFETSFTIEVIEVTGIKITSAPNTTNYVVNDVFDSSGLVISAVYNNSKEVELSSGDYIIDPVDMSTSGVKEVTVRYLSFTASFNINVDELSNYPLISNVDDLLEGDKYVLVYSSSSATAVAGTYRTVSGSSFFEALTSKTEFNNDKTIITKLNSNATIFTLVASENEGQWKLADENGRCLGVSSSGYKKIAWDSGQTNWKITFSGTTASVSSVTTSYGKLKYVTNVASGTAGFTNSSSSGNLKLYQISKGEEIYPTDFSYTGLESNTLKVGKTAQLSLNFTPAKTNKKIISYSSSDTSIASVSNKGLITGVKAGNTTITIRAQKEDETFITKTIDLTVENIAVSSVNLDKTNIEVGLARTGKLNATVLPTDATIKDVSWSSSNTNVATVSNGLITPVAVGNAVITVTTLDGGKTASCNVTVVEQQLDAWTILVYMCGSNLESDYANGYRHSGVGLATTDIQEMISVTGQPNDVNIVIETGGSKEWTDNDHGHYSDDYDISSSELQIHHVANNKIVLDKTLTYANMSASSTLQSFIEYGLDKYPAQKTALILWNHGGAMHGVCSDDYYTNDALTNSEVKSAVGTALYNSNMEGEKLEWIGYDACLMAIQDIAEFNSEYFNYMVASEESEEGEGWDYDTWLDDLYQDKSTETILTAIVDGFIASVGKTSDQTLAWYDLSYMATYKEKWEAMSSALNPLINTYSKNSFQALMKTVKYYGSDDEVEGYSYFGIFDAMDFLKKIDDESSFNSIDIKISECKAAFANLVKYNKKGTKAGNSYGLCLYFPMLDNSGYYCSSKTYYSATQTNFTNWRKIVTTYGSDNYLS